MATHGLPCILRVLRLRRRQVTDRRNSVMYAEKVGFIVSIFLVHHVWSSGTVGLGFV